MTIRVPGAEKDGLEKDGRKRITITAWQLHTYVTNRGRKGERSWH
jgi:hypothetical protein